MDKKTMLNKILSSHASLRAEQEASANAVLAFAMKDENFLAAHRKEKELELTISKLKFENKSTADAEKEKASTYLKKVRVLKALGFNENDLYPTYSCKKCNDTGYNGTELCTCVKTKLHEMLIKESGLITSTPVYFKDYDSKVAPNKEHRECLEKLKTILVKFVDKFPDTKITSLLICGKTGVGKTFALQCVANEIIQKGYTVSFVTSFQLNDQFLKYHTTNTNARENSLDLLLESDLLIIDDLGTEPILKNVTVEYLYLVLNERMLKNKHTILSTNMNLDNIITRYGERVYSRLANKAKNAVVKIDGTDLRFNK